MDIDRSTSRTILIALAGGGLASLIAGLAIGRGAAFGLLVMAGVIGLTAGLAGLALRQIMRPAATPADRSGPAERLADDNGAVRRLDDAQRRGLTTELTDTTGSVMIWASDRERTFSRDFAECFVAAGWQVKITYIVGGVGHDGYQVHRLGSHPQAAQPIISAMWVAGFAIDIVDGGPGGRDLDGFVAGLSLGTPV